MMQNQVVGKNLANAFTVLVVWVQKCLPKGWASDAKIA